MQGSVEKMKRARSETSIRTQARGARAAASGEGAGTPASRLMRRLAGDPVVQGVSLIRDASGQDCSFEVLVTAERAAGHAGIPDTHEGLPVRVRVISQRFRYAARGRVRLDRG